MLVLSRRKKEAIILGDKITIEVVKVTRGKVVLAIDAPRDVPIVRQELYDAGMRQLGEIGAKGT